MPHVACPCTNIKRPTAHGSMHSENPQLKAPTLPRSQHPLLHLLRRQLCGHALAGVQHTRVRALQLRLGRRKQIEWIQHIHLGQAAAAGARQAADGGQRVSGGAGGARRRRRRALLRAAAGRQRARQHLLLQRILLRQRGQLRRGLQRHALHQRQHAQALGQRCIAHCIAALADQAAAAH